MILILTADLPKLRCQTRIGLKKMSADAVVTTIEQARLILSSVAGGEGLSDVQTKMHSYAQMAQSYASFR